MNMDFSAFKMEELLSDKSANFKDIWVPGTKLVLNLNSVLSTLIYREIEDAVSLDSNDSRYNNTIKYIRRIQDTLNNFIAKCADIDVELLIVYMSDVKNTVMRKYFSTWYDHLVNAHRDLPGVWQVYKTIVSAIKQNVKRNLKNAKFIDTYDIEPYVIVYGLQGSIIYITRDKIDYMATMNHRTIIISKGVYGERHTHTSLSLKYKIPINMLPFMFSICGIDKRDYPGIYRKSIKSVQKFIREDQYGILQNDTPICKDIENTLGIKYKMLSPQNYPAMVEKKILNKIEMSLQSNSTGDIQE